MRFLSKWYQEQPCWKNRWCRLAAASRAPTSMRFSRFTSRSSVTFTFAASSRSTRSKAFASAASCARVFSTLVRSAYCAKSAGRSRSRSRSMSGLVTAALRSMKLERKVSVESGEGTGSFLWELALVVKM